MKDGIHILSPTEQALAVSAFTTVVLLIADYESARYWPAKMEMEKAPATLASRLGADLNDQLHSTTTKATTQGR